MSEIRTAIVGIGNCASSLVQAPFFYGDDKSSVGLAHPRIGHYSARDVRFVAAFDVDARKVRRDLSEAIKAEPNCTTMYVQVPTLGVPVALGPVLDGVAPHLRDLIQVDDSGPDDVVEVLRAARAEVVVCELPGGSREATQFYADAALRAGAAFINCNPEPVANDEQFRERFAKARLPLLGDDIKSQLGTTVLHRTLLELFERRGVTVNRTYQLNYGGNTDFLNMRDRRRFASKQNSKTSAISASGAAGAEIALVPPEHIAFLQDHKIAYVRIEGSALLGMKCELEVRLNVEDSPNSSGVALDAIRFAKLALERGIGGVVDAASAYCFKRPPVQIREADIAHALDVFLQRG